MLRKFIILGNLMIGIMDFKKQLLDFFLKIQKSLNLIHETMKELE